MSKLESFPLFLLINPITNVLVSSIKNLRIFYILNNWIIFPPTDLKL